LSGAKSADTLARKEKAKENTDKHDLAHASVGSASRPEHTRQESGINTGCGCGCVRCVFILSLAGWRFLVRLTVGSGSGSGGSFRGGLLHLLFGFLLLLLAQSRALLANLARTNVTWQSERAHPVCPLTLCARHTSCDEPRRGGKWYLGLKSQIVVRHLFDASIEAHL
jgi:hypothetical protein